MVSGSTSSLAAFAYAVSQSSAPPEFTLPAPVASSSGPTRTKKSGKEGRRYDPARTAQKTAQKKEGWDQSLPRFWAQLNDVLHNIRQPSGGLVPATALAEIDKLAKEDLKRSVSSFFYCVIVHRFANLSTRQQPLWGTQAGNGKRARNVEGYLVGLIGALHRAKLAPKPDAGGSDGDDTSVATLSRRECFFSLRSNAVS